MPERTSTLEPIEFDDEYDEDEEIWPEAPFILDMPPPGSTFRTSLSFSDFISPTVAVSPQEFIRMMPEEGSEMPEAIALDIIHSTPTTTGYGQHLRNSFQFFRRNANNRYSASTLMRLANAAGEFDDRTRQGTEASPRTSSLLPVLTVASRPLSYDEDTEVKSGGTVGMMVTWPDGKALFAVTAGSRRQGIGRRIFSHNSNWSGVTPYFWLSSTNFPAQQFLLAMQLTPTALNGNGAVRYGYSGGEE